MICLMSAVACGVSTEGQGTEELLQLWPVINRITFVQMKHRDADVTHARANANCGCRKEASGAEVSSIERVRWTRCSGDVLGYQTETGLEPEQ